MATPSDEVLIQEIRLLLEQSPDLNITPKEIRQAMERKLGVNLDDRKDFIKLKTGEIAVAIMENRDAVEEETKGSNGAGKAQADGGDEGGDDSDDAGDSGADDGSDEGSGDDEEGGESKKGRSGYHKLLMVSPDMVEILGAERMSRADATKALYHYMKTHNLQKGDKGVYTLDEKLAKALNRRTLSFTTVAKALSPHLIDTDFSVSNDEKKKKKQTKKAPASGSVKRKTAAGSPIKAKKPRKAAAEGGDSGTGGGFQKPVPIAAELQEFFGSGPELSRTQVTKKLWEYIREHKLQRPTDKRMIDCDSKLGKLLNVDSVHMFTMTKLINKYFL